MWSLRSSWGSAASDEVSIPPRQREQGELHTGVFTSPVADGWYFTIVSMSISLSESEPKPLFFIVCKQATSFVFILFLVIFFVLRKIGFCLQCDTQFYVCVFIICLFIIIMLLDMQENLIFM